MKGYAYATEKSLGQMWNELTKKGWPFRKSLGLSDDRRYLHPGGNLKGKEGVDYFLVTLRDAEAPQAAAAEPKSPAPTRAAGAKPFAAKKPASTLLDATGKRATKKPTTHSSTEKRPAAAARTEKTPRKRAAVDKSKSKPTSPTRPVTSECDTERRFDIYTPTCYCYGCNCSCCSGYDRSCTGYRRSLISGYGCYYFGCDRRPYSEGNE
ncbi:unnamed protein product [Phytophthora fragariaefolia]|uniref:Unnamed protein product n=1 Tax=Phytophthora fragariaefolia TaxID=1490495 RepID=A0A9W6XB58_9STRA|nr:unnamed protein product [Phytophthora fragariaefolia]